MPCLILSQESFDEKVPSSLSKRVANRPDLKTSKLRHLSITEPSEKDKELLKQVNKQISKSRKILVLTGAGISCNAGIPDFRSSSGCYELVKQEYPDAAIRSGQEMFDISLFREEQKICIFATFMEKLYSSARVAQPTRTHRFIAHLKNRGKLLRCYTQNIDGLEENLGLEMSSERDCDTSMANQWRNLDVVQLHGDLNRLSCTQCFKTFNWNRGLSRCLRSGQLPSCPRCEDSSTQRSLMGKRNTGSIGLLRPNIVLYGENHPSCEFITQGLNLDIARGRPDLFFIMGTSLKVDGVKKLVRNFSKQVHDRNGLVVLINKTRIGDCNWHGIIDYQILSDCDAWVDHLKEDIPEFFKTQQQVEKARQLKRENSILRKRQREERKLTPPSTPSKKKATAQKSVKSEIHKSNDGASTPEESCPTLFTKGERTSQESVLLKLQIEDQKSEPLSLLDASSLPSLGGDNSMSNPTDTTIEDDPTDIDEDLPISSYSTLSRKQTA
ncbi:Protein acetyllysine N-acetyltransferase [Lachancea thermotolerans]